MSARFRNAFRRLLRGKKEEAKDTNRKFTFTALNPLF
jgi:hypothetical protein